MTEQATSDQRAAGEAPPAGGTRTVTFHVSRSKRGEPPHRQAFQVPVEPRTTVLDAMIHIRRHQDPTLTLRHSCFHASCGTCAMRVNGREGLACVTSVEELGGDNVTVDPIANAGAVVSDLVSQRAQQLVEQ